MATKDLSAYNHESIPNAQNMSIAIVVADWNNQITTALLEGACSTLLAHGVAQQNILIKHVPGSFELTFGAKLLLEYEPEMDAVIAIGCVIRGETTHYDYICQSVSMGLTQLNIQFEKPVVFCVLTTENLEQALDRAGGKHGNKGVEAAVTALKMIALADEFMELPY